MKNDFYENLENVDNYRDFMKYVCKAFAFLHVIENERLKQKPWNIKNLCLEHQRKTNGGKK